MCVCVYNAAAKENGARNESPRVLSGADSEISFFMDRCIDSTMAASFSPSPLSSSSSLSRDEKLRNVQTAIQRKRDWLRTNQTAVQEKVRENPLLKSVAKQYTRLTQQEQDECERQLQMLQRIMQHLNELETSADGGGTVSASMRVNLKRDKRDLEREMDAIRAKMAV